MLPREWDSTQHAGGGESAVLVPLRAGDLEWQFTQRLLHNSCPVARLIALQRVQWPHVWGEFARDRGEYLDGSANEQLLFHGTGAASAAEVFLHPHGLDPCFSNGGFYGHGIYLSQDAAYPLGGRYAHRVAGPGGRRLELLLVRANLGLQQELGQRVDSATKAMRSPNERADGPSGARYNSVRAGPHRPFASGTHGSSVDASVIHAVYARQQLYPQYVLEVEMGSAPAESDRGALAVRSGPPPPPGSMGGSGASGSGAGGSGVGCSSSIPCIPSAIPVGPPSKRARRSIPSIPSATPVGPPSKRARRSGPPGAPAAPIFAPIAPAAAVCVNWRVARVRSGSPIDTAAAANELCKLSASHDEWSVSIAAAGGVEALVAVARDGS